MSGPTPVECLHQAGLTGAVAFTRDEWRATDPSSHAQVFVEGPYKTVAYAKASARSLRGVEISVRGGRYVVSALLTSGEGVKARLVANCLELATGRGTIKY